MDCPNELEPELVENNQACVNSPAYQPGPYSKMHEDGGGNLQTGIVIFLSRVLDRQPLRASNDSPVSAVRSLPVPILPLVRTLIVQVLSMRELAVDPTIRATRRWLKR